MIAARVHRIDGASIQIKVRNDYRRCALNINGTRYACVDDNGDI